MTETDYMIAEEIREYGMGDITATIEIGNNVVEVKGKVKRFGYEEDDYNCGYGNGTGAFVTTDVLVSLNFNVKTFDEEGNLTTQELNIDEEGIVKYLERELEG